MPGTDYIPDPDSEFDEFQKNFMTKLLAGASSWNIPSGRVDALVILQTRWNTDFARGGKEADRRHSDTVAKQGTRKLYEKEIRNVTQEFIAKNSLVNDEQRAALGVTVPDTELTDRPAIESRPTVKPEMKGGARLQMEFRVEDDSDRPSMHQHADVVELKWQVGGTEPTSPAQCPNTDSFSKAKESMQLDVADAGQFFYGFARWKNNSDNSKSGPFSLLIKIIISN